MCSERTRWVQDIFRVVLMKRENGYGKGEMYGIQNPDLASESG